jgi:hypothetical protein
MAMKCGFTMKPAARVPFTIENYIYCGNPILNKQVVIKEVWLAWLLSADILRVSLRVKSFIFSLTI